MGTSSQTEECEFGGEIARVKARVNLCSLPQERSSRESILDSFDRLEPGCSLIVIDDCNLNWIEEFLCEERPEQFDRRFFHLHEVAGRKEACVKKRVDSTD